MSEQERPVLLTSAEVERRLNVSRRHVYALRQLGLIDCVYIGERGHGVRFVESSVDAFIEKRFNRRPRRRRVAEPAESE